MRLKGKTAVVTAAGSGIGRAAAIAYAAEGATVHALDIDAAALASLAEDTPSIRTTRVDVRAGKDLAAAFSRIGLCDILFNCAGAVPSGTVLEATPEEFTAVWDLNVVSMVRTIQAVLPGMLANGGGSIINMSSVASSITGVPNRSVYGTTKAAVIGLTKSVAADFVARGIRCNAICPGTVDTPSLRGRIAAQADPEAALKQFLARQPMGRFGRAEEIAAMAVYLAVDESSFVTGQTFVIDGGWTT